MFLSKLFRREISHKPDSGKTEGLEHIAPSHYFTPQRCADLKATCERLDFKVDKITLLD